MVERGHARVVWFVRQGDSWLAAAQHPDAEVEELDAGPGTVWERRVELRLARGARLMRVESRPAPDASRDAMDYLTRAPRLAERRVLRQYYQVGPRGALERE